MTDDERQLLKACAGALGILAQHLRDGAGRSEWLDFARMVETEIGEPFNRAFSKQLSGTRES